MRVLMIERPASARTFGGEQVHMDRLCRELGALGVAVERTQDPEQARGETFDLLHLWNLQHPQEALHALEKVQDLPLARVLTPLWCDPRRGRFAHRAQEHLAGWAGEPERLEREARSLAAGAISLGGARSFADLPELPGYEDARTALLQQVDGLIALSHSEAGELRRSFAAAPAAIGVTPVAPGDPGPAESPALARLRTGTDPFVLLPAARIEPNKNQWLVLMALRDLGLPLVVTGEFSDPGYEALCRRTGGTRCLFVGRISPQLLALTLRSAACVVHCSPIECSSLVAMDAAALNGNLVLGDTGSETETFQGLARVVDPLDPGAIRRAVCAALQGDREQERRRALLRDWARTAFSWPAAARGTLDLYRESLTRAAVRRTLPAPPQGLHPSAAKSR